MSKIRVIVGLGNKGPEYQNTPHNAGFRTIDRLNQMLRSNVDASPEERLLRAIFSEPSAFKFTRREEGSARQYSFTKFISDSKEVYLVKPLLFMNNSGFAIDAFLGLENLDINRSTELLVVYDELDIPMGNIKVAAAGSPGNNNGCKNIDAVLALQGNWNRVKVGTAPPFKVYDKIGYVLSDTQPKYVEDITAGEELAASACIDWIDKGIDKTMSIYNQKVKGKENA